MPEGGETEEATSCEATENTAAFADAQIIEEWLGKMNGSTG